MALNYRRAFKNEWLGQPASAQNVVPASAGLVIPSGNLRLHSMILSNRGAAMAMAAVALLKDAVWEAGQWVNSTTTYTADTTDAQDADTNDFALETATGANDGFIVGADIPFGAISLDITTAQAAASAVHIVEYWNGSAWTAIAAAGMLVDIARSVVWPTGEFLILFDPPADWAKGGSGTNVNQDRYNLRVRGTPTTGTVAGLARRIYVGVPLVTLSLAATDSSTERQLAVDLDFVSQTYGAIGLAAAIADEGHALEVLYS